MKTVALFGATGTIGAYTALHLCECGYQVVAIGHRRSDNGFFAQYGIDYYSVDISNKNDFEKLPQIGVDAVVHLAGVLPARMAGYYPQQYIDSIVTGTYNVVEYAHKCGVDRIVFTQSISDAAHLCGQTKHLIPSDIESRFPLNNDHTIYAICKNAAIDLLKHYHAKYGIKCFILRLPNIYLYHPNPFFYLDGKLKMIPYRQMIYWALQGKNLCVWGNPQAKRDIVYVKDCTQVIGKTLETSADGGMYNVGTGVGVSMEEQVRGIAHVFGKGGIEISYDPSKPDSPQYILDISKTCRELGYLPRYDYMAYLEDFKKEMETNRFKLLWGEEFKTRI